jgi:hypothetical protein
MCIAVHCSGCSGSGVPVVPIAPPTTNFQGIPQPVTGLIVKFNGAHWVDESGRVWDDKVKFNLPDEDVFVLDALADLVVKGQRFDREVGFLYAGAGKVMTDRKALPRVSDAALRLIPALPNGRELTYTCVPPGSGTRIAIATATASSTAMSGTRAAIRPTPTARHRPRVPAHPVPTRFRVPCRPCPAHADSS